MSAHDRWLANYHQYGTTAWCVRSGCEHHTEGIGVLYVSEYGQGWTEPEDCPLCGGQLTLDVPAEDDEDEEE